MRSKILFCFGCLFSLAATSQNDYLTGTWKGTLAIGYDAPVFTIDFTIQLKQEGRFVWGLYTFGNNPNFDSCNCVGKLTTKLNRKNNWLINLYQDGIVNNKIVLDSCASFNYFQSSYSKKGNIEMLGGKWFANPSQTNEGTSGFINIGASSNPVRIIMPINPLVYRNDGPYDGSGGRFILKKVSNTAEVDLDKYFGAQK